MLSRAVARLGEHLAGAFGTEESYEKAYVPWDELMEKMIFDNPEMYGEAELVIDGYDEEPSDA